MWAKLPVALAFSIGAHLRPGCSASDPALRLLCGNAVEDDSSPLGPYTWLLASNQLNYSCGFLGSAPEDGIFSLFSLLFCLLNQNKMGLKNDVWGDRHIYNDLNITKCILVSEYHMTPLKSVQLLNKDEMKELKSMSYNHYIKSLPLNI